jgi:thiamine-phosphate pyrophosphorylase
VAHKVSQGLYALYDDSMPQRVLQAVRGGALTVQLRLKNTPDREALALVRSLRPHVPHLIVDDRVDLALLVGCGVHLGADDFPVAQARALLGPDALIGATCRNLAEIERAFAQGADHVGVGPVFASRLKPLPCPLLGAEGLEAICRKSPLPVVAISGIDESNLEAVAKAGAHAAAISSALFAHHDPAARAALMLSLWGR